MALAGITLAAGLFAYLNGGERVILNLGVATFYRAPLATVVLAAFLLGMVTMFLLGLRHDLKIRRGLRKLEERPAPEPPENVVEEPVQPSIH